MGDCWKYGPKPIELNDKLILKKCKVDLKSPTLIIQPHVKEYIYKACFYIWINYLAKRLSLAHAGTEGMQIFRPKLSSMGLASVLPVGSFLTILRSGF